VGADGDPMESTTDFRATADINDVGVQDIVILATKADNLHEAAPSVQAMCTPETFVVTVQNGLPWWYFHDGGANTPTATLKSLDPTGLISKHIDSNRVIGCVVYPALQVLEPGVIHHVYGSRLPVGEPNGTLSPRAQCLSDTLEAAGFKSRVLTDIRSELWLKALGASVLNPISVITRSTLAAMCNDQLVRETIYSAMQEAQNVASSLRIELRRTIEERIAGAAGVGEHKTSMLQAFEAGSPLELDATTGVVIELGRLTGTPTPLLDAIYAFTQRLTQEAA